MQIGPFPVADTESANVKVKAVLTLDGTVTLQSAFVSFFKNFSESRMYYNTLLCTGCYMDKKKGWRARINSIFFHP